MASGNYMGYADLFSKARSIAKRFEKMDPDSVYDAMYLASIDGDPDTHNNRVKHITSVPIDYDKDKIADMLKNPDFSEEPLREAMHALEYSAYPLFKLRKTTQDILTCRNYVYPLCMDEDAMSSPKFMREWQMAEKIRLAMEPKINAHMIAGQVLQDGKAFYHPRINIDKSHNRVLSAAMQQLPTDWCKIVGYNSVSKYTVAFDMMYFMQPGTDWRQFGDLFKPYISIFMGQTGPMPGEPNGKRVFFMEQEKVRGTMGNPEVYVQNGRWFYWVTLPPEKVWTFECDDVNRNVFSPFTGLFLAMEQVSQYEAVQLALVQNPLISCVLGEIPYAENTVPDQHDPYKLSPTGRKYFEALWYQMLAANNTSGVGLYAAPFQNMHLEQLDEAPSATDVSSKGYKYAMLKAGNGLVPISEEPRAGSIMSAQYMEGEFAASVYRTFEKMMNWILDDAGLKHEWRFKMFGNLYLDRQDAEAAKKDLALGILPAWFKYNALQDSSVLEDIAMSKALKAVGLNDLRVPIATSYNGGVSGKSATSGELRDVGGRPRSEGITSEGHESDIDGEYEEYREYTVTGNMFAP